MWRSESDKMTMRMGTKPGRYEIRSRIGEGGIGKVYWVNDPKIGRDVATKVLPSARIITPIRKRAITKRPNRW